MTKRVLDLFSGIGGFSLGLHRAGGFQTVAFCEIDPFCRSVLTKNWPDVPILSDIKALTNDQLPTAEVICGGFPCQDVSNAGRRAGLSGAKSGLWFDMLRVIGAVRPQWVIVENSAHGQKHWVPTACEGLHDLGFETTAMEIAAHDIGANHERRRCWVLAYAGRGRCALAEEAIRARRQSPELCSGWTREPGVRRVDDGIPHRVDRLRALGNAVVPMIPQVLGEAINEVEKHTS